MIDFNITWFEDNSNQFAVYRDRNPSNMTKLNGQLGSVDWSGLVPGPLCVCSVCRDVTDVDLA